jgi:dTDP-4-dehydrorhamnose reductase
MRIAVTGADGMLGTQVRRAAESAGLDLVAWSRAELDITDQSAVGAKVRRAAPDVVINCAAWTDVDRAETAEQLALAVNGPGAGQVAQAAACAEAWTIHISTDYVFDGIKREPYVESDRPAPLSAYGRTKLEGERAVALAAPTTHTIVRTSWLFGVGGRCFPQMILRLAGERDGLTVVADQVGSPTFTGHLAGALVELAARRVRGLVHVSGGGQCSWFELACAVVALAGLRTEVRPGRTQDQDRPAPRPAYSVLRSERPEAPTLSHWREGLAEFMAAGVMSA